SLLCCSPSHPRSSRFPYTTLFRSHVLRFLLLPSFANNACLLQLFPSRRRSKHLSLKIEIPMNKYVVLSSGDCHVRKHHIFVHRKDRKSTRLNSSHVKSSYAVFCLQ